MVFPPFLIFFQCKSVRKVSCCFTHCRSCFNKVLKFAGDIFNLSNKTRISLKQGKIYRDTSPWYIMYICTGSFFLKKGHQRKVACLEVAVMALHDRKHETLMELPQETNLTLPLKHSHVFAVKSVSLNTTTSVSLAQETLDVATVEPPLTALTSHKAQTVCGILGNCAAD